MGSALGGYINQYYNPQTAFGIQSILGLLIAVAGLFLSKEIDTAGIEGLSGFWANLWRSLKALVMIFKVPVIMKMIAFMFLSGLMGPSFGEFSFYYNSDARGITKMEFGFLETASSASMLVGVMLYGMYLMKYEFRKLMLVNFCFGFLAIFLSYAWLFRLNETYVSDAIMLNIQTLIFSTMRFAMAWMPEQVVLIMCVPKGLEATVFALLIGVKNFSETSMPSMIGAKLNNWIFGLTKNKIIAESMLTGWARDHTYIKMNIMGTVLGVISLPLIWLVPTKAELKEFQKQQLDSEKEKDEILPEEPENAETEALPSSGRRQV